MMRRRQESHGYLQAHPSYLGNHRKALYVPEHCTEDCAEMDGRGGKGAASPQPEASPIAPETPQEGVQKVRTWKEAMPSRGSQRIAGQLDHDEGIRIHPVTVWRSLRREGMARKQRRKRKEKTLYSTVWTTNSAGTFCALPPILYP